MIKMVTDEQACGRFGNKRARCKPRYHGSGKPRNCKTPKLGCCSRRPEPCCRSSTAAGLLLVISTAVAHDHEGSFLPSITERQELLYQNSYFCCGTNRRLRRNKSSSLRCAGRSIRIDQLLLHFSKLLYWVFFRNG